MKVYTIRYMGNTPGKDVIQITEDSGCTITLTRSYVPELIRLLTLHKKRPYQFNDTIR